MVLTSLVSYLSCQSTTTASTDTLIIGKWIGVKKEHSRGRDTLNNGEKMKELLAYELKEGGIVIADYIHPETAVKAKCEIKNGIIFFRSIPWYTIEKLTKTELVLLDYKDDQECLLCFRHYFRRDNSKK